MAFTTEFVMGAGGGAEVQKIPVEAVAGGGLNSRVVMHTAHVPEGETWLVALSGDLDAGYVGAVAPEIFIGEMSIGPLPSGYTAFVAEVTGTAEVSLKRNTGGRQDLFSGHIYTAPIPN